MSEQPSQPRNFRRRGLGRGLEALLTSGPELPGDAPLLVSLDPRSVAPNPEQPRRSFDETELASLAESIRVHGLLHPIVVERNDGEYRLVAGERRLRAAIVGGVAAIPAIVRPPAESARQWLEMALTENVQRTDLNPIEEAAAYGRLADTFGLSHEAIAMRLGKSRPAVSNAIRLLGLPASVQQAVTEGHLTAGHARAILGVAGEPEREALAQRVVVQGLSVRETERAAQDASASRDTASGRNRAPARAAGSADDVALQRGLEHTLGLPVRLKRHPGGGGQVVIDFAEDSDLDSLYRTLGGPQL